MQPADSFIISKIKDAYKRILDDYKSQSISRGEWKRGEEVSSGSLKNPGKHFFLKFSADAVRESETKDLSYQRKKIIKNGMA